MTKKFCSTIFAIITLTLTAATAFADVKIKTRQTSEGKSGETSEYTTYIKGKRQRLESGEGETISIVQCDLRRSIQLAPEAKSYLVTLFKQPDVVTNVVKTDSSTQTTVARRGGTVTTTYTTKDTGERKNMFGYAARRIITTIESQSSPDACRKDNSKMEMDMWVIDAEFAFDCYDEMNAGYIPPAQDGCQDKYVTKNVGTAKQGFQLYAKTTMFGDDGKPTHTSVSEVVELSKTTLDAALFDIPAGYREVKNSNELYVSGDGESNNMSRNSNTLQMPKVSGANVSSDNSLGIVKSAANETGGISSNPGAKKAGVIRFGVAGVKTGSVGEGVNAAELSAAVQNTLAEYLKMPNVELVALEAKLPSAIDAEAKEKECDFVIYATVTHKKGGGGFGKMLGKLSENVGGRAYGSGNTVGKVSQITIMTAAAASGSVKAKTRSRSTSGSSRRAARRPSPRNNFKTKPNQTVKTSSRL